LKGVLIILPLAIVIATGIALRAFGFFQAGDRERLTRLLYWIAIPALLFRTTYLSGREFTQHANLFFGLYASTIAMPLLTYLLMLPRYRNNRPLLALSTMSGVRANNVYLGLPLATLALGEAGAAAAAIYLVVILPGYNLISIMSGEIVLAGGLRPAQLRQALLRVAKNPLILSCLCGLLFAQLRIPVPSTLLVSLKIVGDMATGIALLALGASLELPDLPKALRRTWPDILVKLILHPAIVWCFLHVWPVSPVLMQVSVLISAMPTAINTFIIAAGMGMDERYSCETIAATTILAAVSIPIWIALLNIA
jgi:Predicted permeases